MREKLKKVLRNSTENNTLLSNYGITTDDKKSSIPSHTVYSELLKYQSVKTKGNYIHYSKEQIQLSNKLRGLADKQGK